ncbi:MAG: (d)CMP kinase [candidate division Zixibacteria bacterium]|nr:(d)CMP kinase [candidate division Zixibacteria bacterium]
MNKEIIAIDGPAGSGKSTTAKLVAKRLGFVYLDTGAMYRAITLKALRNKIDPKEEEKLSRMARESKIDLTEIEGENKVYLDGEDVTELIRDPNVSRLVSDISVHKNLRGVLVSKQKGLGEKHNLVAEGRDTTTVVFPQATLKFYLDCDLKERAKRRMLELETKGIRTSLQEQQDELSRRDKIDSRRKVSPLRIDPEAIVVDTTNLTIEEQVDEVIRLYRKKKKNEISL